MAEMKQGITQGPAQAGEYTNNSNQVAVQGASKPLDQLKYEVANQLGSTLGADRTARENGTVGGNMTKRMVQYAEQALKSGQKF